MMTELLGKVVGIIGNGPSGNGQGREIDKCDFVIRMNRWRSYGPKDAGSKVSVIMGYWPRGLDVPDDMKSRTDWELWCNYPTFSINLDPKFQDPSDCVDWKWLLQTADGRAFRTITRETCAMYANHLKSVSTLKDVLPTAGLAAIAMAAERSPFELHLWGFDRVDNMANNPNNDWAQVKKTAEQINYDKSIHDFAAEKVVLADLVDKGMWCGSPAKFKTTWHNRPQGATK